jgi:hypothetical protein
MNAIKKARKLIESAPHSEAATTLSQLVRALESDQNFAIAELYQLNYADFNLAIDILKDWRLDRYYMGKAKLHDLSVQVAQIHSA